MCKIAAQLKALRLYDMAGSWSELTEVGERAKVEDAMWLIEHLLDAKGRIVSCLRSATS